MVTGFDARCLILAAALFGSIASALPARPSYAAETNTETANPEGLTIRESMDHVRALRAEEKFETAIPFQTRALMLAKKRFPPEDPRIGNFTASLANLYMRTGRPDLAEPLFLEALDHREKNLGPDHRALAGPLNALTGINMRNSRFAEAEKFALRALSILEKAHGIDSLETSGTLVRLAIIGRSLNRNDDAEKYYSRALAIRLRALGPESPEVANVLEGMAMLSRSKGDFKKGEEYSSRAYEIRLAKFGPEHPMVAESLVGLGRSYIPQGRFDEAEQSLNRALKIREAALGPDHPKVAEVLIYLSQVDVIRLRLPKAEAQLNRALAIREKIFGREHRNTGEVALSLAQLYSWSARFRAAEDLFARVREIYEKSYGPEHPRVAEILADLAVIYRAEGRYAEAEPLFKHSVAIYENSFGLEHPRAASALTNLAMLYRLQGRLDAAETLYLRALAIQEKRFGAVHQTVGTTLSGLSEIYLRQRRFDESLRIAKRATEVIEQSLGASHPRLADALEVLSQAYRASGDLEKSDNAIIRALEIRDKVQTASHPVVTRTLNKVALNLMAEKKYDAAEKYFLRALKASESIGIHHPLRALTYASLGKLYVAEKKWPQALDAFRNATALARDRLVSSNSADNTSDFAEGKESEQSTRRGMFISHVAALSHTANPDDAREAFEVGQLAQATGAARAVSNMAARFASGTDALALVVRERQDMVDRWRTNDRLLLEQSSKPAAERDLAAENAMRDELKKLDGEIKILDVRLLREFPEFAELSNPRPVTIEAIQKLLKRDEALVSYLVGANHTFVWVVRWDRFKFFRVEGLGYKALAGAVAELRVGLSPEGVESPSDIPPFDTTLAFRLYDKIFAPAEEVIGDARHVLVVPDGALQSLPLGVLITERPEGRPADFAGYRPLKWLVRKYALSVLPSVSSLNALRRFTELDRAKLPFTGFGDPALSGSQGNTRGAIKIASRGAIADVKAVRNLPPLPDTADELRAIAKSLRSPPETIHLRSEATETRVKSENLSEFRVLAFATHGLVAGDLQGADEPSLVLTPPDHGTAKDDGLLTMSEVAQLKLNADWVVLSACNTAAPDGSAGAEGLSGLARAFFYAGSRGLLVSHWPVASAAAVRLTTGTFEALEKNNKIGRAEAFRRSQIAMIDDRTASYFAHPIFWAPFVVVGEGGAANN